MTHVVSIHCIVAAYLQKFMWVEVAQAEETESASGESLVLISHIVNASGTGNSLAGTT